MGTAFRSATAWGSMSTIKRQNIFTPEQCWRQAKWSWSSWPRWDALGYYLGSWLHQLDTLGIRSLKNFKLSTS